MASLEDGDAHLCPNAVKTPHMFSNESEESGPIITVTIGATVPTGFEHTAAEEVQDKIGVEARVSKDRGRIYFQITSDKLYQAHLLRSVDNLFVVVEEYDNYQFKESKEDALMDLQQLSSKLPWNNALEVWRLNNSLKKKRGRRRGANGCKGKASGDITAAVVAEGEQSQPSETHLPAVMADGEQSQPSETHSPAVMADGEQSQPSETHSPAVMADGEQSQPSETHSPAVMAEGEQSQPSETHSPAVVADGEQSQPSETHSPAVVADGEQSQPSETHSPAVELSEEQGASDIAVSHQEPEETAPKAQTSVIKFRVTCNRAGDKHSFSSNEAARDFGGAVQEFFQWKADMTKFDIEVLLNIHNNEVVIGIALTEESLHRRNITHFGPTTLRSTLCYGMLRLCNPQPSDIILDPMCGTGAIPLEGAIEFHNSFYVAGDNNDMAVSRTVNNICHFEKRREEKGSAPGLPINTVQLDVCHLPIRTGFVDVIITDMPFGKRMGSRKRNWDLYPSCLTEMARVCRPGSGKAILLTQDKKCFAKAISRMGGLWRRTHTVWVNVGGLHAGVFLLRRTPAAFGQTPEDGRESQQAANTVGKEREHS